MADIYSFVRKALVENQRAFGLSTTPPPTLLPDNDTAIKYTNLLPSARVMMNWSAPPLQGPYLTFAHISEMERQEQEHAAPAAPDYSAEENGSTLGGGEGGRGSGNRGGVGGVEGGASSLKNEEGKAFQWGVRGGGGAGRGGEGVCGGDTNEDQRDAVVTAAERRANAGKKPKWFKMG